MSKIPCKKCHSCGLYHDLSVTKCEDCDTDLTNTPALMTEIEDIPVEKYGEIDESVSVYVQKCSACGALNFTSDKEFPVQICYNCHKKRVASVDPVEYTETEDKSSTDEDSKESENTYTSDTTDKTTGNVEGTAKVIFATEDDDDDDDDIDSAQWQGMLGNIKKYVGGSEPKPELKPEIAPVVENPIAPSDDDDDGDVSDWSGILGGNTVEKKTVVKQPKPPITLTAIRYGRLSFTIEAKDDEEYMLGRSANQSEFLCNDVRVSNQHCYLYFKNGAWYVKDNHSSNGTAVNSKDLGLNGESRLNDGDELKLGHEPDSMAFKITII